MSNNTIPKNFDLPAKLTEGPDHIPAKAFEPNVVAARKGERPGTLVLKQQIQGLDIASSILERVSQPEDIDYACRLVGMCAFGSSWHSYAQNETLVMRRCLKLPQYFALNPEDRPDSDGIAADGLRRLKTVTPFAGRLIRLHQKRRDEVAETYSFQVGRGLGNAAVTLAARPIGNSVVRQYGVDDYDLQVELRSQANQLLGDTRDFGYEIGATPSLAQLAEPDSPLAVHTRRNAPYECRTAYIQALEEQPSI